MIAAGGGALAVDLAVGSTVLLGLGTLAASLTRSPVQRQRAAELAVVATLVWLILALAPLPRRAAAVPAGVLPSTTAPVAPWTPSASDRTVREGPVPLARTENADHGRRAVDLRGDVDVERASDRFEWLRLLLAVYVVGASIAAANVLLGALLVRRLLARSVAPPPWLAELFESRFRAAGLPGARLRITNASRRPLSAGIIAPAVVLPASLVDVAGRADVCCVIDHELVHIRRGDVASRALFAFAAIPLWAHPLFWSLRARATLASEMIADDVAAAEMGRNGYARALVALSEDLQTLRSVPGLVPGTLRHRSELTRRIEMLVEKHDRLATRWTPARRAIHGATAIAAVALCSLVFGVRPVPAEASPPDTRLDPVADASSPSLDVEAGAVAGQAPDTRQQPAQLQQPPQQQRRQASQQLLQQLLQQPQQQPGEQRQRQQSIDAFYTETLALAERAITLRAELDATALELAAVERRVETGAMQATDVDRVRLNIQLLQRRLEAVMILVESEMQATQLEISEIEKQIQLGQLDSSARAHQVRLQGRLKVLESVL